MILILLVIHIVINSDGPITKEQYLAVDTTQTDELSDNETTYLFQFSDTMRLSSSLSQGRQTRGGQGGHGPPTFFLSKI